MRVTVFGSARSQPGTAEYQTAERLGRLLAARGMVVVSGGYGGLMAAVSQGAREAGGHVVGVTLVPWRERLQANPYLSEEVAAESLFRRLEVLVESDALIALEGGAGTLAEVALAWNLRQMQLKPRTPLVLVGAAWAELVDAFARQLMIDERDLSLLTVVDSVDAAVDALTAEQREGRWLG